MFIIKVIKEYKLYVSNLITIIYDNFRRYFNEWLDTPLGVIFQNAKGQMVKGRKI